jgi:hypothetical protein
MPHCRSDAKDMKVGLVAKKGGVAMVLDWVCQILNRSDATKRPGCHIEWRKGGKCHARWQRERWMRPRSATTATKCHRGATTATRCGRRARGKRYQRQCSASHPPEWRALWSMCAAKLNIRFPNRRTAERSRDALKHAIKVLVKPDGDRFAVYVTV